MSKKLTHILFIRRSVLTSTTKNAKKKLLRKDGVRPWKQLHEKQHRHPQRLRANLHLCQDLRPENLPEPMQLATVGGRSRLNVLPRPRPPQLVQVCYSAVCLLSCLFTNSRPENLKKSRQKNSEWASTLIFAVTRTRLIWYSAGHSLQKNLMKWN